MGDVRNYCQKWVRQGTTNVYWRKDAEPLRIYHKTRLFPSTLFLAPEAAKELVVASSTLLWTQEGDCFFDPLGPEGTFILVPAGRMGSVWCVLEHIAQEAGVIHPWVVDRASVLSHHHRMLKGNIKGGILSLWGSEMWVRYSRQGVGTRATYV